MKKIKKIPVHLLVDEDTWIELKQILHDRGYPRGVASWIAQDAFHTTLLQLKHTDSSQLDFYFDRK